MPEAYCGLSGANLMHAADETGHLAEHRPFLSRLTSSQACGMLQRALPHRVQELLLEWEKNPTSPPMSAARDTRDRSIVRASMKMRTPSHTRTARCRNIPAFRAGMRR